MIEQKTLADGVAVTGQVQLADLPRIAANYRALINNRRDGEEPDQATSAQLEETARRLGLAYAFIPVASGQYDDAEVEAFARALAEQPGPVLAFCRSGTRSASLWALSQAGKRSAADILAIAANAGYDLSPFEPRLHATSAK